METTPKKRVRKLKENAMREVLQIRTTKEEKQMWFDKAKALGYDSAADCFRALIKSA